MPSAAVNDDSMERASLMSGSISLNGNNFNDDCDSVAGSIQMDRSPINVQIFVPDLNLQV